jgi:hypothetical protein
MMKRDPSTGQFPFAINSGQRAEMETVKSMARNCAIAKGMQWKEFPA